MQGGGPKGQEARLEQDELEKSPLGQGKRLKKYDTPPQSTVSS